MWLVRKISRPKWDSKPDLAPTFIAADAVTKDLRTSDNRLSFWEYDIEQDDDGLAKVAAALAGGMQRPDIIDLAWIKKADAESIGVRFEKSEGNTPLRGFRRHHVDAVSLDLSRLQSLSCLLAEAIRDVGNFRPLTKEETLEILCKAVREGSLSLNDLTEEQKSLRHALLDRLKS